MSNDETIAELRKLLTEASPGPWSDCCGKCGSINSNDRPVATLTSGKWGDTYAAIRLQPNTGSIEGKYEAYTAMIEYGEVASEEAQANAALIVAAVNALPGLLDIADGASKAFYQPALKRIAELEAAISRLKSMIRCDCLHRFQGHDDSCPTEVAKGIIEALNKEAATLPAKAICHYCHQDPCICTEGKLGL